MKLSRTFALLAAAQALSLGALAGNGQPQGNCNTTYTLDADFDLGVLFNVNHDAPNGNQLQLNATTAPLPFVNIACSARGTIVRIDVNTGVILGEYLTAPNGMGRNPSRTTVDRLGNVWVSNRDEGGVVAGVPHGSVARIAIVIGGTRGDKDPNTGVFTPNPSGQYLQGPFQYSTAIDRDGDGLIKTSTGLGNILPWSNAGGVDSAGGVVTADDECLINYTRVNGTFTRTVAIDANNDVWTGGIGNMQHEKISGVTGLPVAGTQIYFNAGGYGGVVDSAGVLWSARTGTGLLRYDPSTGVGATLGNACGDYGLAVDPATGNVWHTHYTGNVVHELSPAGACIASHPHGNYYAQGLAVDSVGNVWVAHSLNSATTIGHIRTNGTQVGNVNLNTALGNGNGPTGVAIDTNGKVWVACINSNNALRIDPNAGPIGGGGFPIGAVDMVVNLGAGAGPYNYSDMTGFVSIGSTAPTGSWTVVQDSGTFGQYWGTFSWTSSEPQGTSVVVQVRAADNPVSLPQMQWTSAQNGVSLCDQGIVGRYCEIRATLSRQFNIAATPILYDLTAQCCAPASLTCPADFTEIWTGGIPTGQAHPDRTGYATWTSDCPQTVQLGWNDISVVANTPQNPHAPEVVITRRWTLVDGCGGNLSCDQTITLLSPAGQHGALTLDVRPADCPNGVTVHAPGVARFAITGTWLHDATTIVPSSLRLARVDGVGRPIALASIPRSLQDVTRPYYGASGGCTTAGPEGYTDLVVNVPHWMLVRGLGLGSLPTGTDVEVELSGSLSDGTPFAVRDSLRVQ